MRNENEEYLTAKSVAELSGLSQQKVYAILAYDRLECQRIGGRIVVPKKNYERWYEANIKPKEKEAGKVEKKEVKKEKVGKEEKK